MRMAVQGTCDERFSGVRDEFERNFAERGESGAAVCVTVDGETVVDLWGGAADHESGRLWEEDTLVPVWSCTKGAVALVAHMLVARGELDFDAPVARYWPEFAKNGKDEIPVRMLLSHQSGLAALHEPIPDNALCDWELIVDLLAKEVPFWEPGTRHGYHALTVGHLVGELVRRVTGLSFGAFFREEIAAPLGLDFWVGLPEEHEPRVGRYITWEPDPAGPMPKWMLAAADPTSIPFALAMHSGGILMPEVINQRPVHAAEIPSANGITNARGLAGMYRPLALGGEFDGVRLVPEDAIPAMTRVESAGYDHTLCLPTRWSLGFNRPIDNRGGPEGARDSVILSEEAFGHTGNGGSIGFADPKARLAMAYVMTKQGEGVGLEPRGQALVDATYQSLGYHQPANGGLWTR